MKLSKLFHVISVVFGLIGLGMWFFAFLFWPSGVLWWGLTREFMMMCAVTSFLAAIWLQIATIHHIMLEKKGETI